MGVDWDRFFKAGVEFLTEEAKTIAKEVGEDFNAFASGAQTPEPSNVAQAVIVNQVVSLPSSTAIMTLPEIRRCHALLAAAPHDNIAFLVTAAQVRDWLKAHGVAATCEETGP